MRRFGDCSKKFRRSCAGEVLPPSSNSGFICEPETLSDPLMATSSDGGSSNAAEGPWKARIESKTV